MAVAERRRASDNDFPQTVADANFFWDHVENGKWLWRLPLDAIPDSLFGPAAAMQRSYWQEIAKEFWALDEVHPHVDVPTCTLTGWWDRLSHAASHYIGMVKNGPAETRGQHRLIIGPWPHNIENLNHWNQSQNFGPKARLDYAELLIGWYDFHLKGKDNGISEQPPVALYVVNEDRWNLGYSWPPKNAHPLSLFLHSDGNANTPRGDGLLSVAQPGNEPYDSYIYDPADPVMSLIGIDGEGTNCDQQPLERRSDILVFQTAPLDEDLVVVGSPLCYLWASSDAYDTDFVARLIEVDADGKAVSLTQGIMRARYRIGYDQESLIEPFQPFEFAITMRPIGIRFRRASSIRLDITSSDFPNFDRNHNTGRSFFNDAEIRTAQQSVFHDQEHPSRLVLPVVPTDK